MALSDNGQLLAAGSVGHSDYPLRVFDTATGATVTSMSLQYAPDVVAITPDGRTVALGNDDGTIVLRDAQMEPCSVHRWRVTGRCERPGFQPGWHHAPCRRARSHASALAGAALACPKRVVRQDHSQHEPRTVGQVGTYRSGIPRPAPVYPRPTSPNSNFFRRW